MNSLVITCVSALQTEVTRRSLLASTAAFPTWETSRYTAGCKRLPRELVFEVPDPDETVTFFTKALDMHVASKSAAGTLVAYGPTQLDQPRDFVPGISSFDEDGAHFGVRFRSGPATRPGDGLAYVQFAMPFIRASKLIGYGGTIVEAYGNVNVIAPGGIPVRLLVGDEVRDRSMYVALRVQDVARAEQFYTATLGFHRATYPRARPPTDYDSPFDPNPPPGSVFLAYCDDTFGLLLLPNSPDPPPRSFPFNRGSRKTASPPDVGDIYAGLTLAAPDDDPFFAAELPQSAVSFTDPDGYRLTFVRSPPRLQ
ncbi:hypothetical protein CTAYLR_010037 [Chrysophaeum taylorii]|uniref:Glyoxalase/Bleomycin resistance-like N-terminal domain-containing protein n=1 Tax=Chrysophaeum taylorii TaxID=2483200 RepID=A0AAD7U8W7_9STRA|nr:hypothetical protein CTAYLR_010037 [Chrysophaeum taylorii]